MNKVIDTPWNVTAHLARLRAQGVTTVIRYFNRQNSNTLPEKRLEKTEADAIAAAGMSIAVVFQQRGGSGGHISDLDAQSGSADAKRAVQLAKRIKQPKGSAIYFAVDHDFFRASDLASITKYFQAAADVIKNDYRIGVYGSGLVAKTVLDAGHAELVWLPAATGWAGTKDMLKTDAWALFQHWPPVDTPLPHDTNTWSPIWPDFGQFVPGSAVAAPDAASVSNVVLMEVTARGGLNLRRGAGTHFAVETAMPFGTVVHATGFNGDWIQIDLQGDGYADGHAHSDYLRVVAGGFPAFSLPATQGAPDSILLGGNSPSNSVLATPYDVARAELAQDVREVPGSGSNPRILMYHQSTSGGEAGDDVAWCSSFVNSCVEQAGHEGTDSKWALTWENWGQDVSANPREGDIVVWERVGKGGHVGFLVEDLGSHISVLGGNQNNRVKISTYPKNGKVGSTTYKLRSIRRS